MKLLVYGGCHALIIKRLIDELGPSHRHDVNLIINFELVASGKPFPYENLKDYDAVVYSPVQNKGLYNTIFLDEACAAAGVQAIRFPWLEWHGHAPGADKDFFWNHHSWYFPGLVAAAKDFTSLRSFASYARDEFPSVETIDKVVDYTTGKLAEQETRCKCDVRVSDFILENFRERRMFLIPDHPTTVLYRHVMDAIEDRVGTRLIESWPAGLPELQPEERMPILPCIARRTGLAFSDTLWRSETQPLCTMDLDTFLALHFEAGQRVVRQDETSEVVLATTIRPTWASAVDCVHGSTGPTEVPIFAQVLMRRRPPIDGEAHFTGEVIATLSSHAPLEGRPPSLGGHYRFRSGDWVVRS